MVLKILAAVSQWERETIGKRTGRGHSLTERSQMTETILELRDAAGSV